MTAKTDKRPRGLGRVAVVGVLIVAVGGAAMAYRTFRAAAGPEHPTPRADANASEVLPADSMADLNQRFAQVLEDYVSPGDITRAYEVARQIPEVLDGLHCWCECGQHHGHRSLLTCFESEHGAACWICVREAIIAAELHKQGKSIEEIRATIDRMAQDGTLRA